MRLLRNLLLLFCIIYFTSATTAYSEADAKEFVLASAMTYCSPKSIKSWTCGIACQNLTGYNHVFFAQQFNVSAGETLAFAMISNPTTKRFVVAFRGTVGGIELLLEVLERSAVPYNLSNIPGAKADDYFYAHYVNVLRSTFFTQLKAAYANYSDYQFVFTGHSLGAAFTTLAAFDAISQGLIPGNQVIVYNYGMPRLGNYILAKAIESSINTIYRVVHWKDIVPHVPFCQQGSSGKCVNASTANPLPGSWPAWHVTQEIWYTEDNSKYVACGGDGEDPKCSDQWSLTQTNVINHLYYFGVFMECFKTTAFTVPENYEQNLQKALLLNKVRKGHMRRDTEVEDLLTRIELKF